MILSDKSVHYKLIYNVFSFFYLIKAIFAVLLLFSFLIFIFFKIIEYIDKFHLKYLEDNQENLSSFQNLQNNFCDNFRNLVNKDLEEKIILFNVSFNFKISSLFLFEYFDDLNSKILSEESLKDVSLNIINALKNYSNKYNYENDEIMIIIMGTNVEWYTIFLGTFKYSILSFEPFPNNFYILKKNFCKNIKSISGQKSTVTIVNRVLYHSETYCNYYNNYKKKNKILIICDKNKEKNLDKDFIKAGVIKSIQIKYFFPLIKNKKATLLIFHLEFGGEIYIENSKELIHMYHIPFIFISFNILSYKGNEEKPKNFLRFLLHNGYKISLNGFLTNEYVTIKDLLRNNFVSINLYLVKDG